MIRTGLLRRRVGTALALAGAGCLAVGLSLVVAWLPDPGAAPGPVAAAAPGTARPTTAAPAAGAPRTVPPLPPLTGAAASRTVPVSLDIPAIGVHTPLVRLHLDGAGALVPPADFDLAGWYSGGPAPGQPGPAVLAGHVDSRAGPAVFYRLGQLAPGEEVLVHRADGSTLRYLVAATVRYPKARFPTGLVYAPVPDTELRLITCGGTFDRQRRSYRDDIVVSAVAGPL